MAFELDAVYIKPNGVLLLVTLPYSAVASLRRALPLVAVYVRYEQGGQTYTTEFAGNSAYDVFYDEDGVGFSQYDDSPENAKQRHFGNDGVNSSPRVIEPKVAKAVMRAMDVYENGSGSEYEIRLEQARQLVGFPG